MRALRLLCALALLACAQDVLTNDSVLKMVKSGLGENLILNMVQNQPGKYVMSADELVKLKQAGVSDKILDAMIAKSPAGTEGSASRVVPTDADIPQNIDVGVYYRKSGSWEEMLPEVVNWKTGGVLKHVASAGIVKGDVNGNIQGGHSRNSLKSPVEVLIYAREGVAITEYQLIRLHENANDREFRTITGGVMHESGGATRDLIPFEGKKVAARLSASGSRQPLQGRLDRQDVYVPADRVAGAL